MKGLKKLALATAVAAAPFAQAELTAMDDALLEEMTGQAGITIDVDLEMSIGNIIYVDQSGQHTFTAAAGGAGTGDYNADGTYNPGAGDYDKTAGTQGAITISGITMDNDGGAARIRGITIDADGSNGLVMGIEQIGDTSGNGIDISVASVTINSGDGQLAVYNAKQAQIATEVGTLTGVGATFEGDPTGAAAFLSDSANAGDPEYDAAQANIQGAMQLAGFNAQDGNIGGFVIEDFRNYVQDDLVSKYNGVFGMALADSNGAIDTNIDGDSNGRFVRGEFIINGTGNAATGTGGLSIQGKFGGAMDKLAWVDGYGADTDTVADGVADSGEFGVKDVGFFAGLDTDGDGLSDTIDAMTFTVDIDVEDHVAWDGSDVAALKLSGISMHGTVMLGELYVGSSTDSIGDQSLGSVLIKDIDMTNTNVYIYGH